MNQSVSAYIHIPFCEHICYYCNFNKVFLEGQPVDAYIEGILKEIELTLAKYPIEQCETIYIGGGTPTSLSATQLDRLLTGVHRLLPTNTTREFTIEANPGDLTADKISVFQEHDVRRLSMGVQTLDDRLLKKIGRKHTAKDVYHTIELLKQKNFDNVSIDLIYALPGQTYDNFRDTLEQALDFDLSHYSLYSLILENKTMFMNWIRQGRLELPSQEEESDMFQLALEKLGAKGYQQYEISNFAKPGFESQHNLVYWNNENYFGFGAGASGYVGNVRYKNFGPIQHYLKPLEKMRLPILEKEILVLENQIEEELFLGLRKKEGVSKTTFKEKFGIDFEDIYGKITPNLVQKGWLVDTKTEIRLTTKGMFVGNEIFEKFLLERDR